jgi:hypothetical protein
MKWALTAVAALLIAACGSGAPQPPVNQTPVAQPALEPPPEWNELQDLATSIHETFPELPKWEQQLAERTNKRDGTEYLKKVGIAQKDWRTLNEESPDWMHLRAQGKRQFESWGERTASGDDIETAINNSTEAAAAMKALSKVDVLTVFDLHDEANILDAVGEIYAMRSPLLRVELLMAAGQDKLAVQELDVWLDVMMIADRNDTRLGRHMFNTLLIQALELLVDGSLRPFLLSESVHKSLGRLREEKSSGFWDAEWRELAYSSYAIRTWKMEPEDMDAEALKDEILNLRIQIGTVDTIGAVNLDPTQPDVYADMKRPYSRVKSDSGVMHMSQKVLDEVKLRTHWLAYDLARMDIEAPLVRRPGEIAAKVKECPALIASFDEATRRVSLKLHPDHPLYKDLFESDRASIFEFELREPPKNE